MAQYRSMPVRDVRYGKGTHSIDVDAFAMADPDELKLTLLSIFRSPTYRPPMLPEVALELTELSRKPNVGFSEVARVIERDPIVAAEVLKVAQSPLYTTRLPVQSLADALNRLGMNGLRDIVWQIVAGLRLFRVKGYTQPMQRLQAHSLFTAHMARLIAGHAGLQTEHAFLCGLLHDVGVSGTLIALAEQARDKPPELDLMWAALDRMHAEAAGLMARMWGLSPEVCEVLEHHHQRVPAPRSSTLVSTIVLAESFADELGFGLIERDPEQPPGTGPDQNLPKQVDEAAERLNLRARLTGLRSQAVHIAQRVGSRS